MSEELSSHLYLLSTAVLVGFVGGVGVSAFQFRKDILDYFAEANNKIGDYLASDSILERDLSPVSRQELSNCL